jgi:hypothetical protein
MPYGSENLVIPESVVKRGWRGSTGARKDTLERLIKELPGRYSQLRQKQKDATKLALTGLGEYEIGDNPNTSEVEEDAVFRKNKRIGSREARAVQSEDAQANARGMQFSSFRDKGVGDALGRLSREAKAVVTEYADRMGAIADDEKITGDDLVGQLSALYGEEADYLRDNPELPTPQPESETPASGGGDESAPAAGGGGGKKSPEDLMKIWGSKQGWKGPWSSKPNRIPPGYAAFKKTNWGITRWFIAPKR